MNTTRTRKRPAEREGIRRGELTATVDQVAAGFARFAKRHGVRTWQSIRKDRQEAKP